MKKLKKAEVENAALENAQVESAAAEATEDGGSKVLKILKRVVVIGVSVVLWVIILLAALYAFVTLSTKNENQPASILGISPLIVQSDSMSPTFDKGDLIIIRKCDPSTLQKDDIITFHTIINNDYALNTHRIVKVEEERGVLKFTTHGDNDTVTDEEGNPIIDPETGKPKKRADDAPISDTSIVGKYVVKLPILGKLMGILSTWWGFLVIIVLPMLAFFIYQVYHLITVSIKLKKAVAKENAEEEGGALAEAEKARAEAEAALAEAKRLKEEAAALAAKSSAEQRPAETPAKAESAEEPAEAAPAEEQPVEGDPAN